MRSLWLPSVLAAALLVGCSSNSTPDAATGAGAAGGASQGGAAGQGGGASGGGQSSGAGQAGSSGQSTGGAGQAGSSSGTGGSMPMVCVPGASVACVGPAACQGGQVCLADGSAYGPCDCGGAAGSGGAGGAGQGGTAAGQGGASAGAGGACTSGEVEACSCPASTAKGTATCLADGSGFGACMGCPMGAGGSGGSGGGAPFMATYPGCARDSSLDPTGGCGTVTSAATPFGYICASPPAGCVNFDPGHQCCPKMTPGEAESPVSGPYAGCKSPGFGGCQDKPATLFAWPAVCATLPPTCVQLSATNGSYLCCPEP